MIVKKYVFFVAHSMKDSKSDIESICEVFEKCSIKSFVADRDAPLGDPLPASVKQAIDESQLFLVFLTKNSKESPWVNQEIGYALGREIPVVPIKKGRIRVKGLIEAAKYVQMKDNPLDTVLEIFSKLNGYSLDQTAQAAIGAVVGILELKDKYEGGKK